MRTELSRKNKIQPVILCGGKGRRLWPFSTSDRPKPFAPLPYNGEKSLFSTTLTRVKDKTLFHPPLIIGHKDQITAMQAHCEQAGISATIITEPVGRNTAPALAVACHIMQQRGEGETPLLILPADHQIAPLEHFYNNLKAALPLCLAGQIVLFGVKPHAPVSEFGYIIPGSPVGKTTSHHVQSFIEKPDKHTAQQLIDQDNALWNSGIFMLQPNKTLQAFRLQHPALLNAIEASWAEHTSTPTNKTAAHTHHLGPSFANTPTLSFDKGIIEHEKDLRLIIADFSWADLGLWRMLWEQTGHEEDNKQGTESGAVIAHDCRNSPIHSEGPLICAIGLENIAVYARDDMILIAPATGHDELNAALKQARALHDQKQGAYKKQKDTDETSEQDHV